MSDRMMVVGAHSADFVWRAGGAVATFVAGRREANVIALTYGERGESGVLWKEEGQTRRTSSGSATARPSGPRSAWAPRSRPSTWATTRWVDEDSLERLAELMRDFAPTGLTHPDRDPFNPDHPVAYEMVQRARLMTSGPAWRARSRPHPAEVPGLRATPAGAVRLRAVRVRGHHRGVRAEEGRHGGDEGAGVPADVLRKRAEHRGNHARRVTGNKAIRQAEAFMRVVPNVWVDAL